MKIQKSASLILSFLLLLTFQQDLNADPVLLRTGNPPNPGHILYPVSNMSAQENRYTPMWGYYGTSGGPGGGSTSGIPAGTYYFSCIGTGTQPTATSLDLAAIPVGFRIADLDFTNIMKTFYVTSLQDLQNGNWTVFDLNYNIANILGYSSYGVVNTLVTMDISPLNISIDQNNSGYLCFSIVMRSHLSMAFSIATRDQYAFQILSPFTDATVNGLTQTSSVIGDRIVGVFIGNN